MIEKKTIDFCIAMAWQGGIENVINLVGEHLLRKDFRVRVIQMIDRGTRWTTPEIEFHCLNAWETEIDWDALMESYRCFAEEQGVGDLLFAVGWPAMTLILREVLTEIGASCPLIGWPHGTLSEYEKDGVGGAECFRLADRVFAISALIQEEVQRACPNTPVVRVKNPIQEGKVCYSDRRNEKELAFVGRISPEKNLPYLLRSLAEAGDAWTLTIVGDGEDGPLRELIEELHLSERIHFLGWQEHPFEQLKGAGALVLPSYHEGFSLTMLEALASGMMVLSTPVGGAREIIEEGENGYLFGGDTGRTLNEILEKLDNGQLKPAAPERCRESVKPYLEREALFEFTKETEKLLKEKVPDKPSLRDAILLKAEEGYQVFFVHNGLGETIFFLEYLSAWREKNQKPVLAVTMENSRAILCEKCPVVDEVLEITLEEYKGLSSDEVFRQQTGMIDLMDLHFSETLEAFGGKLNGKVQAFLGLETNVGRQQFPFSFSEEEIGERGSFAKNNHIDLQRVVYLVPDAFCFGEHVVSENFWQILCDALRDFGYIPIFNANHEIIKGVPYLFPDLLHTLLLVDACKKVVGVRTGLMDVFAAFTDALLEVIYPDDENTVWMESPSLAKYRDGSEGKSVAFMRDGGSVSDNFRDEGVVEFVHTEDKTDVGYIIEDIQREEDKNMRNRK